MGLSLTWPKSTKEERKNSISSSLFLSLLADGKEKEEEEALFLSILLRISITLSLPWLNLVLLSHSWLKIRRRRKCSFSLPQSLYFSVQAKIKGGLTKASLLLVNVKVVSDKTWGRDHHLMQETWGNN